MCFTETEDDYLHNFEIRQRNLYGLPEVHKSLQITSACSNSQSSNVQVNNVTDLKLRPIIAGPSCLTHRLSNLLDILLRPLTGIKVIRNYWPFLILSNVFPPYISCVVDRQFSTYIYMYTI